MPHNLDATSGSDIAGLTRNPDATPNPVIAGLTRNPAFGLSDFESDAGTTESDDSDSLPLDSGSGAGMTGIDVDSGSDVGTTESDDSDSLPLDSGSGAGMTGSDNELSALDADGFSPLAVTVGATKQYWYGAASPNAGGAVEWVYTGDASTTSTTPTTVSTWADLTEALNRVGAYAADEPYVILISGNITQTALYTFTDKNVILRKAIVSGSITQRPWNYATWPYPNPSAASPDLYDGEADFSITVNGNFKHFSVTGTASKLSLENITLNGDGVGRVGNGVVPSADHGGIQCTAPQFTFSGNIANCVASGASVFWYNVATGTLNIAGGVFSNNCSYYGAGLAIFNVTNVTATVYNTVFENNYASNEGGGIYFSGSNKQLTVSNTLIRNNETWRGSSGIAFLENGGTLTLNAGTTISGNISKSTGDKGGSQTYPGNGGAIELSGASVLNMNDGVRLINNTAWRGGGAISSLAAATINLNGGEISGNQALGIYRQRAGVALIDLAIGSGGAIYTIHPELINIPSGSTVTFSNNSAAFVGMNAIGDNGVTPADYQSVFTADTNYNNHIVPYTNFRGSGNSARFPVPYDNLYNGYDIGVPSNLATAYGKLRVNATAGGSVTSTVTTAGQDFQDIFPAHDWLGLKVGANARLVATPAPGYRFTGWTRASATLEAMGPTAYGVTNELNVSVPVASLANATLNINGMPPADLTLTANFALISRANLTGFGARNLSAPLSGGTYTPPSSVFNLVNSGNANATAVSITLDAASFKKDGDAWTGVAPFTIGGAHTSTVAAGGGTNDSFEIVVASGLTDYGNYTGTMTLSYNDGVAVQTRTAQVSFALIDPTIPLVVLSSHDFGSVVGSNYTVGAGSGFNVEQQSVEIQNLSVAAAIMDMTLAGTNAASFSLTPGTAGVPATGTNDTWKLQPVAGLAPGVYVAELHIEYTDTLTGTVSLASVAPVTFTVIAPALLTAVPLLYDFGNLSVGYSLPPSPKQVTLNNSGAVDAVITTITPDAGVASSAFSVISGNADVSAGGTNSAWQVVPKAGLAIGVYDESFTVTYTYTDATGPVSATATFEARFIVGASVNVTVTYNANMGSAATGGTTSAVYGGVLTTAATTTRANYTFGGWYTSANPAVGASAWVFGASGTALTTANGVSGANTLTLFAKWEPRGVTVTWYRNWTTTDNTQIARRGTPVFGGPITAAVAPANPVRTGYTFVGWATTRGAGAANWTLGATAPPATALTAANGVTGSDATLALSLYAVWQAKGGYSVTYTNLTGATPASIPAKTNVSWTAGNLLPAGVVPVRPGFAFAGWYDTLLGGTRATDATTYGSLAGTDTVMSAPLYARFAAVTVTPYNGIYDGAAHGASVSVPGAPGATVAYGRSAGTYDLTSSPTRTDVGTTTAYWRVTIDGYATVGTTTVTVGKAAQSPLTLVGLSPGYTYGDSPVTLRTTGGSGTGVISYTLVNGTAGVASLITNTDGTATLTLLRPGSFTVSATKAQDTNYNAVTSATVSSAVAKAVPPVSLSVTASGAGSFGDDLVLTATVGRVKTGAVPTGSVAFYIDGASNPVATIALDAGGQADYTASGLAGGPHSFVVRYLGNSYYKGYGATDTADAAPSVQASASYTVGLASQAITLANPGNKTYGDADFTLRLSQPGAGTGPVTYTAAPSGVLSISGTTATVVGTGSVTITAIKAADSNYNAATSQVTITVAKATPVWSIIASGTQLTYGQFLSVSGLNGVVGGVGTHASDTLTGTLTWDAPATIPDVSTVPGTPAGYAVTFYPTGTFADNYTSLTGTASLITVKATPTVKTALNATPLLMNPPSTDTLADSTLTGGNTVFDYGNRKDAGIAGTWSWDDPALFYATVGNASPAPAATFTPDDTERFNTVSQSVTVQVFSPKTVITVAPTAGAITYGDAVGASVLDISLAEVYEDTGAGPDTTKPIPGTWAWSAPADFATSAPVYRAEVTFTPDNLATPPLTVGNGYLASTVDVEIQVNPAIPVSLVGSATNVVYGEPLSTSTITDFTVTGVFGETIDGTLVWTDPALIPSDELGGTTGLYTASVTFTPASAFTAYYVARDFTLTVHVIPDTAAIDDLVGDTVEPLLLVIHDENYTSIALAGLRAGLLWANTVRLDTSYAYTQADVDDAYAALEADLAAMLHDHPVLFHSRPDGITATGQDATVEFKGYFGDVNAFGFGGKTYTLGAVAGSGDSTLAILDGTGRIGTVTQGSAVVHLEAAFLDTLTDGTYTIELGFADTYTLTNGESFKAQGRGTSELVIKRATALSDPPDPTGPTDQTDPTDPAGPSTIPRTGDDLLPLYLVFILGAVGVVCLCARRRRLRRQ